MTTVGTILRMESILKDIQCSPFEFRLYDMLPENTRRMIVKVAFTTKCAKGGTQEQWRGREFLLHDDMTDSEVVQTCFLAALVAEEHELRERFLYQGQATMGPHFNHNDLASALRNETLLLDAR